MDLVKPAWFFLGMTALVSGSGEYKLGKLTRFMRFSHAIDPVIVLLNTTAQSRFHCISQCFRDPDCVTCLYHRGYCTTLAWYLHIALSNPMQDKDVYFYYGKPVIYNIALYKPASQSSNYGSLIADNAVDGMALSQANQCLTQSHTADWDKAPWFQIDLLNIYKIIQIRFVGKTKPSIVRLHDINIITGDTPNTLYNTCAYYVGPPSIAEWVEITCSPQTEGRFVKLDKRYSANNFHLELCELEITVMA